MTFLSPLFLWFLAAVSVPVIIHLLNKRRHKTVQWAAMQFLLKATRESRGKKKLRHIIILACRALAIAALVFAAARPVVSNLLGWGAGTIDTVVLILDRSASMELRSAEGQPAKRELILQKVRDTMADLGDPRLVLIDSATGRPQEVPSPDVLPEISSTSPTDSSANFPSLMTAAAEFLATSTGRSEIWLTSDLQRSNWRPEDERWAAARASLAALPQQPSVRVLSLTGNSAPNVALRLLGTRRTAASLTLDLELVRSEESRGTLNLPLTLSVNGATTTESVTIPGQVLRFQKTVAIGDSDETGRGWLSVPADGNPRDNTAFFAYGPAQPVKSLVVAPPGEAADYLALAAAPPGFGNQTAERIDPAAFAAASTGDISMILWAAPLPSGNRAAMLERFLTAGGQVLIIPTADPSGEELLGMEWQPVSLAESGKFLILQDWERADGPLRDGSDSSPIPAGRLRAIKRAVPEGEAAVLARWEDGEAFLARRIIGKGTLWALGSTPDYTWSNLGDADVLLPAVQRILALGAKRFDASFLAEVGSDTANPPSGETRIRVDDFSDENSPHVGGVFRIGDRRLTAVNRPLAEDDPEIVSRESLDAMLEGTGYSLLDQATTTPDSGFSTDIWRAFLVAMLFFLISEALLCLPKKSSPQPIAAPNPSSAT